MYLILSQTLWLSVDASFRQIEPSEGKTTTLGRGDDGVLLSTLFLAKYEQGAIRYDRGDSLVCPHKH